MSDVIKIKKGFNINLAGKAEKKVNESIHADTYAIQLEDFPGLDRPKVLVQEGDIVKAGTPLFFDKKMEQVMFSSPVSGEVVSIKRGEKRKLLEIKVLADKKMDYAPFQKYAISDIANLNKDQVMPALLQSGAWTNVIQRPFGIIADPDVAPKAIFVSTFDTHPLAPDYDFVFKGQEQYFQAGVDILRKVGKCDLYLGISGDGEISRFAQTKNAQIRKFAGKHPAGNVGVQIHHTAPISKGETVWTLTPYAVILIGKLFLEGKYDTSKIIAVAGSEVQAPQYYKTYLGANVNAFLKNNLKNDHIRIISGNVLTGKATVQDGHLGYYDQMLTVIPEGDKPRFFLTEGWLAPVANRVSMHRAFGLLSFLSPKKEFVLDTSTNGEERSFVVTGTYEQVMPMDILPMHLVKAILAKDYDAMESLGIYEVIEEDFALCEFVDVAKQPIQEIIREGIDLIRQA